MFFQGLLFALLSLFPQVLILLSLVHLLHEVGFLEICHNCGWMSSLYQSPYLPVCRCGSVYCSLPNFRGMVRHDVDGVYE